MTKSIYRYDKLRRLRKLKSPYSKQRPWLLKQITNVKLRVITLLWHYRIRRMWLKCVTSMPLRHVVSFVIKICTTQKVFFNSFKLYLYTSDSFETKYFWKRFKMKMWFIQYIHILFCLKYGTILNSLKRQILFNGH